MQTSSSQANSLFSSILLLKCPRCRKGDQFETSSFSFQKPFDMYDRCPVCNQNYLPEPGFYYGAMFISYIISGWFSIGFVALFHWVFDWSITASFALLIFISAVFFVYIFRLARSIWLHLNVRHQPERADSTARE